MNPLDVLTDLVDKDRLRVCHWCEAGNPRIRSSVTETYVHTDTPLGRVVCKASSGLQIIETLRADHAFLKHYLDNYLVHVATKDERGHVVNGFAAAQIPDWAIKQRLDDIKAAITILEKGE